MRDPRDVGSGKGAYSGDDLVDLGHPKLLGDDGTGFADHNEKLAGEVHTDTGAMASTDGSDNGKVVEAHG